MNTVLFFMFSISFQEETKKMADQSDLELLPISSGESATKSHSSCSNNSSDGSLDGGDDNNDDTDAGAKKACVKGKKKPQTSLIQVSVFNLERRIVNWL